MENERRFINSKESEIEVLSSCLVNTFIYEAVQDMLHKELFTDYDCSKTYEVMERLSAEGKQPTLAEVAERLVKDKVDMMKFMTMQASSFELTKQHIAHLEDLYVRRRMQALGYKIEMLSSDPTVTMDDIQNVVREFDKVANNMGGDDIQTFGSVLTKLVNDVADRMNGKSEIGMMTGLHIFDSRYGFHGGDLVIIAGETSQGKSTLATTIAYNMGCNGIPTAYYSMEMSSKQLVARIMGRRTRVEPRMVLHDKLSDDEYKRVYDNSLEMRELPIFFDEDSKTTFPRVCGSIKKMVRMHGIRVVFIDYLQILANGSSDNREQIIGDMARDLKRMAVELDICIVALSQLSRSKEKSGEPSLNRMRGSGQIEEACDIGVLVYRPNKNTDVAKIYIAKGRNIGLASEKVRFNTSLSYFCDFEAGDTDKPYQEHNEQLPF